MPGGALRVATSNFVAAAAGTSWGVIGGTTHTHTDSQGLRVPDRGAPPLPLGSHSVCVCVCVSFLILGGALQHKD